MLKLKPLLLLTLAALSLAWAPRAAGQDGVQAAAWARYTYPGDEFSVEAPGMPFVMHTDRGIGRYPVRRERMRVFGRYADGVLFIIAAYDRPYSSESHDTFTSYLRGAWEFSPKGEVTLGGFEGRAYEVTGRSRSRVPLELHGEGRVFITKKHAYFALAFSTEEGRPEVGRFLDSLTLGPSPSGEKVAESPPVPRFTPPQATAGSGVGPGRGGDDDEERLRLMRPEVGAPARDPNARKAIIVYRPEPAYTEAARRSRASGTVRLRVVLSPTGEAKDISVLSWLPDGLTESAIRAARYMLFFPATKDGRPVSQYVTVEHNFNIY